MELHQAGKTLDNESSRVPILVTLGIEKIRRDGGTQGRLSTNTMVVHEYAALMKNGDVFPPVRVWFDGNDHWLSDGFHRIAAAEAAGFKAVTAEVLSGTLNDALWDSCVANAHHGIRRSRADVTAILGRAFKLPHAALMSNVEIAKQLGIPETTVRRWRKRISSPPGEDSTRLVRRGGAMYTLHPAKRANSAATHNSSTLPARRHLISEFHNIKLKASVNVTRVIAIIERWLISGESMLSCLNELERLIA